MCGAPATDASVWYTLTGADNGVVVDVSSSDYSAGVIVATGSPGSFELETCGPGAVAFFASSGTTYSILAFDDQRRRLRQRWHVADQRRGDPATADRRRNGRSGRALHQGAARRSSRAR